MPVVSLSTADWLAIALGFAISLGAGFVLAGSVVAITRKDIRQFPIGWWSGVVERSFFTTLVFFNFPSIPIAMIAYIAAKMVAGWNLQHGKLLAKESEKKTQSDEKDLQVADDFERLKRMRFAALYGGLMSMLCAAIGGLVANGHLKW